MFKQEQLENFKADGICGLGLSAPQGASTTMIDNLKSLSQIEDKIFSFYFSKESNEANYGNPLSEFIIGGYDR